LEHILDNTVKKDFTTMSEANKLQYVRLLETSIVKNVEINSAMAGLVDSDHEKFGSHAVAVFNAWYQTHCEIHEAVKLRSAELHGYPIRTFN
jgi:hypothetical protein